MRPSLPALIALIAGVGSTTVVAAIPEETPQRHIEVGLDVRFMPVGWFDLADPFGRSFRAFPALGGELFADFRLGPILSVGVGGEVTGNVIPNRSDYVVGTMVAGTVRLGARLPTQGRFVPFALVTGGYSSISFSSGGSSAQGALIGGAVGVRFRLGPTHAFLAQFGYEHGFQTLDGGAYSPHYLVTAVGWSMGF